MQRDTWNVELLGGLKARYRDQEITRFPTRKVSALLTYLAYYADRTHTREQLVDLYWPDLELQAARHNLRQTLFSLRRCLEPATCPEPLFIAGRTTVRMNSHLLATDVAGFEQAMRLARDVQEYEPRKLALGHAVQLYHGELLPGFYEEWILAERDRLSAAYQQTLRELQVAAEQAADFETALDSARRLVAHNNLDEEAHHVLIRLCIVSGRYGEARRRYELLDEMLRTEFGGAPSAETQALMRRIAPSAVFLSPSRNVSQGDSVKAGKPFASSLPAAHDSFFGRYTELEQLLRMIRPEEGKGPACRLLTLTGPGGSGKTRLAIELAHRLARRDAAAVYFVALADLDDPGHIPMQIASALGLSPSQEMNLIDLIAAHLNAFPACLILDNFEHLVDGGADFVADLLQRAPELCCLMTSRRRLGLAGEQELLIPPLPTPQGENAPECLTKIPSVALYMDRVRMMRPDFALTVENAAAIAALCDRLEGIPLAIELAAARSGVLSPQQLLAHLDDRFRILVAQRRPGTVARHGSLRAALDVSYALLSLEARRLFRQLSIFRGGWTLEAAVAVTGEPDTTLIGLLEELRDNSLISTLETRGGLRFRMLESLREYGREHCAPEELTQLMSRHADHYLALAEATAALYPGPDATDGFDALERDHDNLRAALTWSNSQERPQRALRLAAALWRFWLMRGHYQEGREWLQIALDRGDDNETVALRAGALCGLGMLALSHGDIGGQSALETSLTLYRRLEDRRNIALILLRLGRLATSQDDAGRARAMLQEGLSLGRALDDRYLIAEALYQLSYEAREQGDTSAARALLQECLTYARRIGNREFLGDVTNWLGTVALLEGDSFSARHYHDQAVTLYRETRYEKGLGWALLGLGNVERAEGDAVAARSAFTAALRCFHGLNDRVGMFHALLRCAYVEEMAGRPLRAAHLMSAAETLRSETGFLVQPSERPDRDRCLVATQSALDSRLYALVWSDAAGWSLAEAVRYAFDTT